MTLHPLSRRAFLQASTLLLLGSTLRADEAAKPLLRIALVTDLHYADKPTKGTRHYRDTLPKLDEMTTLFSKQNPHLLLSLGDHVDTAADLPAEKSAFQQVVRAFSRLNCPRHALLGNHCVETLTKSEALEILNQPRSYYSFDAADHHFILLDACFREDGAPYGRHNFHWSDANIPPEELDWLRADLRNTPHKTLVFTHQCLDMPNNPHGIKNAPQVREILEQSNKVLAVFQGHYHRGGYNHINNIHYCTLKALIEGPAPDSTAYATLDILPNHHLRLTGHHTQPSFDW